MISGKVSKNTMLVTDLDEDQEELTTLTVCKIVCNYTIQNIIIYDEILPKVCGCTWVDDNDFLDN